MATNAVTEGNKTATLGPLLRMRALDINQIPAHPSLASQQKSPPDITTLVSSALKEAENFITSYLPSHFAVKSENKQSPPSTAPIKVYSHDINAADLPAEARQADASTESWFARTSIHQNEAKEGTASWQEFDSGLRVNHSQHEKEYTPGVLDAHEVLNWKSELDSTQQEKKNKIGEWEDIEISIMEMLHSIPSPLNNRLFTVLVITARKQHTPEFIVVQIPVSSHNLPNTKYTSSSNSKVKVTEGMYVSIEHGTLIEDGKQVQWSMATASNAKGNLPMWAQKMGVPGAIVKDVGFFIDWCAKGRKSRGVRCLCCNDVEEEKRKHG